MDQPRATPTESRPAESGWAQAWQGQCDKTLSLLDASRDGMNQVLRVQLELYQDLLDDAEHALRMLQDVKDIPGSVILFGDLIQSSMTKSWIAACTAYDVWDGCLSGLMQVAETEYETAGMHWLSTLRAAELAPGGDMLSRTAESALSMRRLAFHSMSKAQRDVRQQLLRAGKEAGGRSRATATER